MIRRIDGSSILRNTNQRSVRSQLIGISDALDHVFCLSSDTIVVQGMIDHARRGHMIVQVARALRMNEAKVDSFDALCSILAITVFYRVEGISRLTRYTIKHLNAAKCDAPGCLYLGRTETLVVHGCRDVIVFGPHDVAYERVHFILCIRPRA